MTRAVSLMGSPRPSCESLLPSTTACPPSSAMAISKLTRVRVEAFSKMRASMRPGRVACGSRIWRTKRSSSARRMSRATSASLTSHRLRKSRLFAIASAFGQYAIQDRQGLVDLVLANHERRREAHDMSARHREQKAAVAGLLHHGRGVAVEHDTPQKSPAARAAGFRPAPLGHARERRAKVGPDVLA